MFKKLVSLTTAVALVSCLCGFSVYARTDDPKGPPETSAPPKEQKVAHEKLKADMTRLVADAKAGKLKMPPQQFPQHRNNLSKGAKIAIFAGIGAAIFLIIMFASLADDDS